MYCSFALDPVQWEYVRIGDVTAFSVHPAESLDLPVSFISVPIIGHRSLGSFGTGTFPGLALYTRLPTCTVTELHSGQGLGPFLSNPLVFLPLHVGHVTQIYTSYFSGLGMSLS